MDYAGLVKTAAMKDTKLLISDKHSKIIDNYSLKKKFK